ncbi:MAG TPA: ATP-dependent DNA helicase UvrD2, partial [Egibacteraceae bacterium]|nr:ATP-dependent DNA helicase UvrD2 [Egibacteraceae bacterium]
LLDGLNAEQRLAVETLSGPVCILAGAGSGKTRTITHRIAHQVATGSMRADQVLAVTFTDKAAAELRHRLRALGLPGPIRAATFHSAAWAQLRHFWPEVRTGPLPELLSSKVGALIPAARRHRVEAQDLAAEIEWAKARCLDPEGYTEAAIARDGPLEPEPMTAVYRAYEQHKADRNLIDFDDMLLLMTRIIFEHPSVAAIIRERYRSVTVDEFQDVNPAQWSLLRAWLGDSQEVCVVGDDDQMIYSFTGASSSYLTGFRRTYPDASMVTLTANYRSTAEVLELANRVLRRSGAGRSKRLEAQTRGGPAPKLVEFADAEAEIAGVLAQIRRLLADGVRAREIAVCYRVNSQSEPYEEALRDAGIPYALRGEGGFFARREIRQALSLLQRAAGGGRKAFGPPPVGDAKPAAPARVDREVERVLREGLSWHPRREPAGEAARERWRNLAALLDLARQAADDDPGVRLPDFVADLISRAAAGDTAPGDDGAVTLLTLHRAKGLEFDAVLVVGLEEGMLPISYAKTDAEIDEERRLLYVGVTRARRWLWLSWARSRPSRRGKPVARRPSRFLYGLGPGAPQSPAPAPGKRRKRDSAAAAWSSDLDPALVERLRAWRLERSKADGKPAFVVFSDRTLAALAAERPASVDALHRVHGLGPAKVSRYGEDILRVLAGDQ